MSLGTTEQRTVGMKKQVIEQIATQIEELIEETYQDGVEAGKEQGKLPIERAAALVEQGRNEAWEAASKLVSMGYKECNKVLNDGVFTIVTNDEIFVQCTASEAIEKIRAYEQKKQEEDAEIHVGDEVYNMYAEIIGIVTHISEIEGFSILWRDGSVGKRKNISDFKKTGRHFPQISEVLKKMKEGEK